MKTEEKKKILTGFEPILLRSVKYSTATWTTEAHRNTVYKCQNLQYKQSTHHVTNGVKFFIDKTVKNFIS